MSCRQFIRLSVKHMVQKKYRRIGADSVNEMYMRQGKVSEQCFSRGVAYIKTKHKAAAFQDSEKQSLL